MNLQFSTNFELFNVLNKLRLDVELKVDFELCKNN
jgi:hypothetical protein